MGTATGDLQYSKPYPFIVPTKAAATATVTFALGKNPLRKAATVTAVTYTPVSDIVGADTDSLTLNLINKGSNGNGTTVVATLALAAAAGTKVDFVPFALTLSAVEGALDIGASDVLAWQQAKVGTGLTDPGGCVEVTLKND